MMHINLHVYVYEEWFLTHYSEVLWMGKSSSCRTCYRYLLWLGLWQLLRTGCSTGYRRWVPRQKACTPTESWVRRWRWVVWSSDVPSQLQLPNWQSMSSALWMPVGAVLNVVRPWHEHMLTHLHAHQTCSCHQACTAILGYGRLGGELVKLVRMLFFLEFVGVWLNHIIIQHISKRLWHFPMPKII